MKSVTIIFMVAVTLVILAFDLYALRKSEKTEYTISYIIAKASLKNPLIPFMFGVLMGHWFFYQCII